jgi:hypothetical protein
MTKLATILALISTLEAEARMNEVWNQAQTEAAGSTYCIVLPSTPRSPPPFARS